VTVAGDHQRSKLFEKGNIQSALAIQISSTEPTRLIILGLPAMKQKNRFNLAPSLESWPCHFRQQVESGHAQHNFEVNTVSGHARNS